MYVGTGEVYGSGLAEPGTIVRLTRGSYGLGILKTVDGGKTWSRTLRFDNRALKGVQDIEIDPYHQEVVLAATTDGVYRSVDAGSTWTLVLAQPNCFDIEIDPVDSKLIYVSQGNFNGQLDPAMSGIYKSTDGGATFQELLDPGLIQAWSGNAKLAIDPNNHLTIYASIQVGWYNTGPTTPGGLYKSTNGGKSWKKINNQNIAFYQGWYSHDIAINPKNSKEIIYTGINSWKSTDTGLTFAQQSGNSWNFHPTDAGIPVKVPVEMPEGDSFYVHSDIHAVYFHPLNNKVFYATDGGVFVSKDGTAPFTTLNGGMQTSQIYADMASSATNPGFCIIGMQDNASYVYDGTPSWSRFIGGDGMTARINQEDDNIIYASAQGLYLVKVVNLGLDTSFLAFSSANFVQGDFVAFSAPYVLAPSNQNIIYGGTRYLYKSMNGGETWQTTTAAPIDGASNAIIKIAVSPENPDLLYIATSTDPRAPSNFPKIMKSADGGKTFAVMNGLPNRIAKDIEFNPLDSDEVFVVFSGFGSDHVFMTSDGGKSWKSIGQGLPDVPTNTIFIDPKNTDDLYVGNDLGVFFSMDKGVTWTSLSPGLPEAVMVYDLNYSPSNRKIRIATHGHGVYQRDPVHGPIIAVEDYEKGKLKMSIMPNPVKEVAYISIEGTHPSQASLTLINTKGLPAKSLYKGRLVKGANYIRCDIPSTLPCGLYYVRLKSEKSVVTQKVLLQ